MAPEEAGIPARLPETVFLHAPNLPPCADVHPRSPPPEALLCFDVDPRHRKPCARMCFINKPAKGETFPRAAYPSAAVLLHPKATPASAIL